MNRREKTSVPTTATAPQAIRWRIPVVLGITIFINYLDRNNLSLALPQIAQEFDWTDREVGSHGEILLAAFFLSYALSNMLLSPLAERFGPKRSVIAAIVAFSCFTILSAPLGGSLTALIVLRLLLGLGEGVHIPMLSAIISRWFAASERSRANAIWGAGILMATATAPLIVVPLTNSIGWRYTFALLGIVGMVVSLPLVWFCVQDNPSRGYATPACNEFTSEHQRLKVKRNIKRHINNEDATPYIRDLRFWLTVIGGILNAFCAFGILNWLPTYFNRAKGIDFQHLGWVLALIFAAGLFGMLTMAYLGDKLQHRTLLAAVGFLIAGLMVYLAATAASSTLLVLYFTAAVFCQSAYAAQEYAIVQRLLPPTKVGTGTGLYNGLSILFGGVAGSLIPGSIISTTGSFDMAILSLVVGALLAAAVMFALSRLMDY